MAGMGRDNIAIIPEFQGTATPQPARARNRLDICSPVSTCRIVDKCERTVVRQYWHESETADADPDSPTLSREDPQTR
jgi:hypothetical protein